MRMGKTKQPTYRVVAADARSPRGGRFIEILGTYAPRREPSEVRIDVAKATKWLAHGAQPTEAVDRLLRIAGVKDPVGATEEAPGQGAGSPGTAHTETPRAAG
jgi:small subunit ribosomal protein S16